MELPLSTHNLCKFSKAEAEATPSEELWAKVQSAIKELNEYMAVDIDWCLEQGATPEQLEIVQSPAHQELRWNGHLVRRYVYSFIY